MAIDQNGERMGSKRGAIFVMAAALVVAASTVNAAPEGGQIVAGRGAINQSKTNTTVIEQQSNRLAIDWQRFNVAPHEQVRFQQPSSNAAALNRIFDQNPSQILGRLDANGRVLLLNPNGLIFGPQARVNVNALIAAAGHMDVGSFMAGKERLILDSGELLNAGELKAAPGGAISLLGRRVENSGLIEAQAGRVNLVSGERLVIDFEGDGLLRYAVADAALAEQLSANEAAILMSSGAAEALRTEVVNSGTVRAGAIERQGGAIRLIAAGGYAFNRGTLDATGQRGGKITVSGNRVALLDQSLIDVSGELSGGVLSIGAEIGQSGSAAQRLYVGPKAQLKADAGQLGNGGSVRLWSEELTDFRGHASARGGAVGGNGGLVEVSARHGLRYRGTTDVTAPNGSAGMLLLDPRRIVVIDDAMGGRDDLIGDPSDGDDATLAFTEDPDDLVELSVRAVTDQLKQGANVVLQAHNDIKVKTAINVFGEPGANGASLTLEAGDDLVIDGAIVMYQGDLNLIGGSLDATPVNPDGTADVTINYPINTTGGALSIDTSGAITTTALIDSKAAIDGGSAGAITIRSTGDQLIDLSGGLVARGRDSGFSPGGDGGNIKIENVAGSIVTGLIDSRAGSGTADGTDGRVELTSGAAMTINSINAGSAEILATVDPSATRSVTLTVGDDITGMLVLRGGSDGNDTLAGPDQDNRWDINAPDAGLLNGGSFTDFANLQGGAAADRFVFPANGALSGDIDGGHGTDLLDYSDRTTTISINLADNSATDLGGAFSSIESITGSSATDQIVGTNAGDTWTIDGPESGSVVGLHFSSFELLTGGDQADRFVIEDGGSISAIDGGGDADSLDFSNRTSAVSVDMEIPSATGVGSFTGIESLTGSLKDDILAGTSSVDEFDVNGLNRGKVNGLQFESFERLDGAAGGDLFKLNGDLTGGATGGAGADTFTLGADMTSVIAGGADNDRFVLAGGSAPLLNGESGSDTLQGTDAATQYVLSAPGKGSAGAQAFDGMERLVAGGGADRFVIEDLGGIAEIDAGHGADLLDFSKRTSGIEVNLGSASATGVGAFSAIESVLGSASEDTLVGTALADEFEVDGLNRGTANGLKFEDFERLDGAAGADLFKLNDELTGGVTGGGDGDTFTLVADMTSVIAGGSGSDRFVLAGGSAALLDGESGTDTLEGTDAATQYDLLGSGQGRAGGQQFESIERLIAGKSDDRFVIADGAGFTEAQGGDGADVLDFSTRSQGVEVSLSSSGVPGVQTIGGFESLLGSSLLDILIGTAGADVFAVTERDGGAINGLKFASFERLDGGSGADQFLLAAGVSDRVDGGAGSDRFELSALAPIIDGGADTDLAVLRGDINATHTVTFTGIEQFDTNQPHLVTVPRLSISGASAGVGTATAPITLNTAALDWWANGGSYINNRSGLNLERVEVGGNLFALTLQQGSLSQAAGTSIDAGKLVLDLPAGLGSRSVPLRTTAAVVDISTAGASSAGDIFIDTGVTDLRNVSVTTAPTVQTIVLSSVASRLNIASSFTGGDHLEISAAALSLNGSLDSAGGNLTLSGPLSVNGGSSLVTRGGSLLVRNAVSGPGSLSVNSGAGGVRFSDSIGTAVSALQSIAIAAAGIDLVDVTTVGNQRYTGSLRLAGDLTASDFQFDGPVQLLADIAMTSSSNTFGFGGTVSGPGNLALLSGQRGSLTVAAAPGPGRVPAAAFRNYSGHLVIGALLDPLTSPGRQAGVVDITTDRVIIDTPLMLPGELTVLASNIDINADVGVGATRALNLIAVGDSQGFGTAPGNISGPTQGVAVFTGASALLVANNDIVRASNIRLDLNGGPALVAVASQQSTPSFNLASNISSSKFNPQDIPLLASLAVALNIQPVQLVLSNPAQLVAVQGTPFIDVGVFETELSLVNVLGGGLALDVFQCEDAEICAASMDIPALDNAINRLRARMQQIEAKLESGEGDAVELEILLETYQEQLRHYEEHRRNRSAEQGSQQALTRATPLQLPADGPNLSAAWAGL